MIEVDNLVYSKYKLKIVYPIDPPDIMYLSTNFVDTYAKKMSKNDMIMFYL